MATSGGGAGAQPSDEATQSSRSSAAQGEGGSSSSTTTERRGPDPNDLFYCYTCEQEVDDVSSSYECPLCGGGFIESVAGRRPSRFLRMTPPTGNEGGAEGGIDFGQVLAQMLRQHQQAHQRQQQSQQRQAGSDPSSSEGAPNSEQSQGGAPAGARQQQQNTQGDTDADPMQQLLGQFFQQLMGNLGGEGGQIHIRLGGDGAGGAGGATLQFGLGGGGAGPLHGQLGDYAWGPQGLDAIVTQLLNQFDGAAPNMTQEQIDAVPSVTVDEKLLDRSSQCSTCFDDFTLGDSVRQLPCRHIFHNDCIVPWMQRNNTCPICRKSIPPSNETSGQNGPAAGGNESSGSGGGNSAAMRDIDELD